MANLAQQRRNQHIAQVMGRRAKEKLEAALIMEEMAIFHAKLPVLDEDGKPTGEYDRVESRDRLSANKHYIDTLSAPARGVNADFGSEALPTKDAELLLEDEDALETMSDADLRQLAHLDTPNVDAPNVETENPWA